MTTVLGLQVCLLPHHKRTDLPKHNGTVQVSSAESRTGYSSGRTRRPGGKGQPKRGTTIEHVLQTVTGKRVQFRSIPVIDSGVRALQNADGVWTPGPGSRF